MDAFRPLEKKVWSVSWSRCAKASPPIRPARFSCTAKSGARAATTRCRRERMHKSSRCAVWKSRFDERDERRRRRKPATEGSRGSIMAGAGAALIVVIFFFGIFMLGGVRVLNEYERAGVVRLGRLTPYRGPGVTFIIPMLEKMARIDLRTVTLDIAPQDVITRDNVTVKVSAVLYFRVLDPSKAVTEVADYLDRKST